MLPQPIMPPLWLILWASLRKYTHIYSQNINLYNMNKNVTSKLGKKTKCTHYYKDSKSRYWYRKKFDITLYIYFHDL